jgi:hypothetical protein
VPGDHEKAINRQGRTLRIPYRGMSFAGITSIFRINASPFLDPVFPIAFVVFDENDV